MRIYYDTEFLEDGETIELISIGMVAEDGREYYAVNRKMPIRRIRRNSWLMENVVPGLPRAYGERRMTQPKRWLYDYASPLSKEPIKIAGEVADFIRATPDVELWASYGAYDHVALAQLWGSMINLPDGIPMWTNDLQQEAARLGLTDADLPRQPDGHHNALADARHNKVVAEFLATI